MITPWPHQVRGIEEYYAAVAAGFQSICIASPTGMGKGWMIGKIIEDAIANWKRATLYTNRKLLMSNISGVLDDQEITYGRRSAEHEQDFSQLVQLSSIQTEASRVLRKKKWALNPSEICIVDEAHNLLGEQSQEIKKRHFEQNPNTLWVGFTATPLNMASMYDHLIVAGTKKEGRECGALVTAKHYSISEPDMRRFTPNIKTGEYKEGDVVKAIMTPNVFGRVWDHWLKHNPDQKPTMLFAPGVQHSIGFAEEFRRRGVRSAHLDGMNCWIDGETYTTNPELREEILKEVRQGKIPVLTNRFVLREGVNLPEVEYLILATVIGSLSSYLQIVGRGLRASPKSGKTQLSILDHGGHQWRHPSANADIPWELDSNERAMIGQRIDNFKNKSEREPFRCPKCDLVRLGGRICGGCGFASEKRSRLVVQQDGTLVEVVGEVFKPRRVRLESNTVKVWKRHYYGAFKSGKTFKQALGYFKYNMGYDVPLDLPLMPKEPIDFYKKVKDVPKDRLIPDVAKTEVIAKPKELF